MQNTITNSQSPFAAALHSHPPYIPPSTTNTPPSTRLSPRRHLGMARRCANSTTSSLASTSNNADRKVVNNNKRKKHGRNAKSTALRRREAKIEAMKPKKPPTAFFYFLEDFRKEYQQQNPQVKAMRDIGKACGEKWKTMTYEEKVHYYDVATQKRKAFDVAMEDFIRRKENGEFDECDSDLDDDSEFEV